MNIGDRVRVLHGTEEGIITKVVDNNTVEIEIDDGFSIPVLISEVVLVESKEEKLFAGEISIDSETPQKQALAEIGIYTALILNKGSDQYELHIINNTDNDLLVAVFRKEGKLKYGGLFRGIVKSKSAVQFAEFKTPLLSTYNELYVQILVFSIGPSSLRVPLERQVRIAKMLAGDENGDMPIIRAAGWLKQLDDNGIEESNFKELVTGETDEPPSSEVDLHAEALGIEDDKLSSGEILNLQLEAFHSALDKGIVHGLKEITFIHGIGQGTLKKQIIKEIRKHKEIRYWEDAKKEKFGYGATKVVL